ncbi:DUF1330 domain-containing protein [Flagellatimonas centrodinii]|uniref:DUF1330 domain-containing protein n=1 Tax=Flagellatimonas centrodinii TaxID=2806210 RepID=UPI001FEE538C|nr:DUF1330 domain-containing protein [Flagellatimonas centrodinii]ULQ47501.1 DUF1330 domain-containing protein [Flagellatimonas centrodinii]
MKTYVVAELTVTDPSWVGDYLRAVTPLVEAAGGRYLARTPRLERLEGDRPAPNTAVILEFPSRDAALAFYHSDAYQPWKAARLSGSNGDFLLVAGEDVGASPPR